MSRRQGAVARLSLAMVLILAASIVLAACGREKATTELVIYSGRNENLIKPIIEAFEEQTGVKVVLKSGGGPEMAAAILEEKAAPKADVVLINDAGLLGKLQAEGVLFPYLSDAVKSVPTQFRAEDGSWTGITLRSRVIMYNKNLVSEPELPTSIFDLADPKWKGQIAMANGTSDAVIASTTAYRLTVGEEKTRQFLEGLVANQVALLKGHIDVRKAVGKGEFKLGWVNSYYYHLQTKEPADNNVGVVYPDQDGIGTVINVSGAGIVKGGPNLANAKKFIDFLLSPETQKLYAEVNYEMPIVPGVPVADGVRPLSEYKLVPVSVSQYAPEQDASVKMIDEVGLVTK